MITGKARSACLAVIIFLFLIALGSDFTAVSMESGEKSQSKSSIEKADDAGWNAYESEDYELALKHWMPLAEAGNYSAKYGIGLLYLNGQGVNQDYKKALRLFLEAVDQSEDGDTLRLAALNIASMVSEGFGVPKSQGLSDCFMEASANNGHARAQWWMGHRIRYVPERLNDRIIWFQRSANQGDKASQMAMSGLALTYDIIELSESFKWLSILAKGGSDTALQILKERSSRENEKSRIAMEKGKILAADWKPILEPIPSPPIPVPESCIQQLRSAMKGPASQKAANAYDAGWNAYEAEDYQSALEIWGPLAEAGDYKSSYGLGLLYMNGHGVTQGHRKALRFFYPAVSQSGDGLMLRQAALSVFSILNEGSGVPRAPEIARCFLRNSAENGNARAQLWMGYQLRKSAKDINEMIAWYRRSANQGDVAAQWAMSGLGFLYDKVGLAENYKWLSIIAQKSDREAMNEINEVSKSKKGIKYEALQEGLKQAANWEPIIELAPNPPLLPPEGCLNDLRARITDH